MFRKTQTNPFVSILKKSPQKHEGHGEYQGVRVGTSPREHSIANPCFGEKLLQALQADQDLNLEDGRVTKAYFDRLKMVEFGCMVMSLIGVGLSIMQYELEYSETEHEWSEIMLYYILISSLLLSLMTVVRYIFHLEFKKRRNLISSKESLWSTGAYKYLLLEIMVIFIIPYPWLDGIRVYMRSLDGDITIYYHINEILGLFNMIRLGIVLRVVLLTSVWNTNRAQRICEMYAVQPGALLTLKCIMKTSPFTLIFTSYLVSIPYFAYVLRIAEVPFDRTLGNKMEYDYSNSMWNIVITMTTVGFGDYFPRTFLGRIVIFFVCLWGTTISSLMVVTLTNILQMGSVEGKAFNIMQRLIVKEVVKEKAGFVLTNLIRIKYKSKNRTELPMENVEKLRYYLKDFKNAFRLYRETSTDVDTGFESMERQFHFMRDQIKGVLRQEKYLIETNKLLMTMVGIDPVIVEKLDDHLKPTILGGNRESIFLPNEGSKKKSLLKSEVTVNVADESSVLEGLNYKGARNIPYFEQTNISPVRHSYSRQSSS